MTRSASGLAVDGSGNLFVTNSSQLFEVLAAGGYTTVKALVGVFYYRQALAVDGSGNVFVTNGAAGPGALVQEILAAGGYTTVKTLTSWTGFTGCGKSFLFIEPTALPPLPQTLPPGRVPHVRDFRVHGLNMIGRSPSSFPFL